MAPPASSPTGARAGGAARAPTPIPLFKVLIIASVNMLNSICSLMTYPFVPFLVLDLLPGVNPSETGYYSGALEGAFHVGAFLASMPWGWFSDTKGRRPALLSGLAGTAICTVMFGFSRSFGMALATKFMWGALNSTVGVAKTCLSELTDDTNSARAFSFIGIATGFGRLIGPSIGGLLSEPAKKYPSWFDIPFWRTFPYLLPCLVASCLAVATLVSGYINLEETLNKDFPKPATARSQGKHQAPETPPAATAGAGAPSVDDDADDGDLERRALLEPAAAETQPETGRAQSTVVVDPTIVGVSTEIKSAPEHAATPSAESRGASRRRSARQPAAPQPWRRVLLDGATSLITCGGSVQLLRDHAIRVSTVLYTLLGLLAIVGSQNFPLYALNDAYHGGFGWNSSDIGMVATLCGPPLILYQAFVYDRLVRNFGVINVSRMALGMTAVLTAVTPLCGLVRYSSAPVQWIILSSHFTATTICRVTSFTCIFIFVANSALPGDRGKVNGLGQALSSAVRSIGPAAGTAIFAWSVSDANIERGWPWDYHFTFYLLSMVALACLSLTYALPPWIASKRAQSVTYGSSTSTARTPPLT